MKARDLRQKLEIFPPGLPVKVVVMDQERQAIHVLDIDQVNLHQTHSGVELRVFIDTKATKRRIAELRKHRCEQRCEHGYEGGIDCPECQDKLSEACNCLKCRTARGGEPI